MQAPVIFICLVVATLSIAESASPYQHAATIESDSLFVLSNGIITARITKKTAAVVSLFVPSCLSVEPLDIALGYENTTGYLLNPHPNFNSIVGRVANRISGARFSIPRTGPSDKQKTYYLEANDGNNTLHSGSTGYSYQTFTAPRGVQVDPDGVRLELLFYSPNGQGGFPGNVASRVQYFLPNGEPELQVLMTSVASQTTPINVIYHNYFNLNGPGNKSTILNHNFTIHANLYAPLDAENIPTGELLPVKGTYLDFTSSRQATWSQQNWPAGKSFGYDNMYSLLRPSALSKTPPISLINPLINPQVVTFSSLGSPLAIAAEASSPITGICSQVFDS